MRPSADVSSLHPVSSTAACKRQSEVKIWKETANKGLKSNSEAERELINKSDRPMEGVILPWDVTWAKSTVRVVLSVQVELRRKAAKRRVGVKKKTKKISPFTNVSVWVKDFRFGFILASPFHHQAFLYTCQCWRWRCKSLNFWVLPYSCSSP